MRRVLVASDLSERSDRAVARGIRLGKSLGAEVQVIAVIDDDLPADMARKIREGSEAELGRVIDAEGGGASVEAVVRAGPVVDTLLGHEVTWGAELLVLGLHRPRSLLDGMRATTMESLVRLGRAPVLLVREPAAADYARAAVAVSFSPACAAAVRAVHAIAPGASVRMVHAMHVPFQGLTADDAGAMRHAIERETRQAAASWAAAAVPNEAAPVEIVEGGVGAVMGAAAAEADLFAIGAHTRHGLGGATLGSFAASLVRKPPTDLLVARA